MKYTLDDAGLHSKVLETLKSIHGSMSLFNLAHKYNEWFTLPRIKQSPARWAKACRLNDMLTTKVFADTTVSICTALVQQKQTTVSNILGSCWRTIWDWNQKESIDNCIQCTSIVLDALSLGGWVQIYKPEPKKQYFNQYGEVLNTEQGQWLVELKLQALLDLRLEHVVTNPLWVDEGEEQPPIHMMGNTWAKWYSLGKDHCQGTMQECLGSVEYVHSREMYEFVGGFKKPENMEALEYSYYYEPIKEAIEANLDRPFRNRLAMDHRTRSYFKGDMGNYISIKPERAILEFAEGEIVPDDE